MTAIDLRWLASLNQLAVRAAAEREEQFARAHVMLRSLGVESYRYRNGIIVAESDVQRLRDLATFPQPFPTVDTFGGIPIYSAPDWTFDLHRIAFLRLRIAVLDSWARPLLRWIAGWVR